MTLARFERLVPAAATAVVVHLIVLYALGLLHFDSLDAVRPALAGNTADAPIPVLLDPERKPLTRQPQRSPLATLERSPSRPVPTSYRPREPEIQSPTATRSRVTQDIVPVASDPIPSRPPVDIAHAILSEPASMPPPPNAKLRQPSPPTIRPLVTRLPQSDVARVKIQSRSRLGRVLSASYPSLCARRGHEGATTVRLTIGRDGKARDVRVVRSAGCSRLDRALRETLSDWRFDPASRGGLPIETVCELEAVWRLTEAS
jgi:protein TonB